MSDCPVTPRSWALCSAALSSGSVFALGTNQTFIVQMAAAAGCQTRGQGPCGGLVLGRQGSLKRSLYAQQGWVHRLGPLRAQAAQTWATGTPEGLPFAPQHYCLHWASRPCTPPTRAALPALGAEPVQQSHLCLGCPGHPHCLSPAVPHTSPRGPQSVQWALGIPGSGAGRALTVLACTTEPSLRAAATN